MERIVDAAYRRRGWTADGVPTLDTLQRTGLDDDILLDLARPRPEALGRSALPQSTL